MGCVRDRRGERTARTGIRNRRSRLLCGSGGPARNQRRVQSGGCADRWAGAGERVGRRAAALPLTTITAWEMLFDRLDVTRPVPGAANAVLIIGAAGGVGSIAMQLLRARTDLT